jgi:TolB protein
MNLKDRTNRQGILILLILLINLNCSKNFNPIGSKEKPSETETPGAKIFMVSPPKKIIDEAAHPAWSPDGKWIAFSSYTEATRQDISIIPADGGEPETIVSAPHYQNHPFWSPDGKILGFSSDQKDQPQWNIYAIALDTKIITQITPDSFGVQAGHWSPDGENIVFDSGYPHHSIITIQLATNKLTFLTPDSLYEGWPKYSFDGSKIVFESLREGNGTYNIWSINSDGANLKQITHDGGEYPCWSPDGRWIAYSHNTSGEVPNSNYDIYIIAADGGEPIQITISNDNEVRPDWSPDGKKIAYDTYGYGLWVVEVELTSHQE